MYSDLKFLKTTSDVFRLSEEIEEKTRKSRDQAKRDLEAVKKKLSRLPVVSLTIAYRPSGENLDEISAFIKEQVAPEAVLDISTDSSIVGGAIISFKGKYVDLSARKSIADWFSKKK